MGSNSNSLIVYIDDRSIHKEDIKNQYIWRNEGHSSIACNLCYIILGR